MSLKVTDFGLSFSSVAAGATATARLPIGRSYEQMMINYAGATLAQLSRIVIKLGTKTLFELSAKGGKSAGQRLDRMNQYKGRAAAAGSLILDFNRFGLRTRLAEEITKLGTGIQGDPDKINQITCEIVIDGAALNPTLSSKVVMSEPDVSGALLYTRETQRPAVVGELEIADLPLGSFEAIQSITLENAVALGITRVVVKRDNVVVFDRTKAENDQFQSDGVRVPQADLFVYDPTENGYGEERLDIVGVQALQIYVTCGVAGNMPIITEYLGGLKSA